MNQQVLTKQMKGQAGGFASATGLIVTLFGAMLVIVFAVALIPTVSSSVTAVLPNLTTTEAAIAGLFGLLFLGVVTIGVLRIFDRV